MIIARYPTLRVQIRSKRHPIGDRWHEEFAQGWRDRDEALVYAWNAACLRVGERGNDMSLQRQIKQRVLNRARAVLTPLGQWPRCRSMVPAAQIARALLATLPGDATDYEVDHVLPLAGFDLTCDDDVQRAFAVGNHQWLRRGFNQRKGAR